MVEVPKKRARVASSCVVCRRRKIKCNRARPACDQCTATGLPHVCYYEDPGWLNMTADSGATSSGVEGPQIVTNAGTDPYVLELLERIRHLEQGARYDETHSSSKQALDPPLFYANERVSMIDKLPFLVPTLLRTATIEFHGAMSAITDIKTDPYLKVLWIHMWKYLDLAMQNRTASLLDQTPVTFKTRGLNSSVMGFLELRRQKLVFKSMCEELKDPNMSLEEKLLKHMPPRRTIVYLIDIYFTELYPLLPVVQQHTFIHEDMERILGGWVNQHAKPTKLDIKDRYEFTLMGILFAVMACATLTLRDQDLDEIPDLKPLKKLCPAIFAQLAHMCVDSDKIMRQTPGLKYGLVFVLLKFYHHHCPEGDTVSDMSNGRINMGIIVSMIRANGIFCDPSNGVYQMLSSSEKSVATYWRRLCHTLMAMDSAAAAVTGMMPRFMDDSAYDTELPGYDAGMSQMEMSIIDDFKFLEKRTKLYRRLSIILFQRKNDPTIGQLLDLADELRDFAKNEVGSFEESLKNNLDPHTRAKKVTYILQLNGLESGLRQRAISHFFTTKNTPMMHQQFSILLTLVGRMLNTALNVAYNVNRYFGRTFAFYMRPTLLYVAARVILSLGSLIGRCAQYMKKIPLEDKPRARVIRDFQYVIIDTMDRAFQLMKKTNIGFYKAQRMNLGFTFFLTMLRDPALDFDKAREDVISREDLIPETKALRFTDVKSDELTDSNFLNGLLDSEIDNLKMKLQSDLADVLQPFVGERIHIDVDRENIFNDELWNLTHHFDGGAGGSSDSGEQREEAELSIQKSISTKFMNQSVDTVFAGSDTIQASNVLAAEQLAGLDTASTPMSKPSIDTPGSAFGSNFTTLTGDQFGDIFGVFEDYNWFTSMEEGGGLDELRSI